MILGLIQNWRSILRNKDSMTFCITLHPWIDNHLSANLASFIPGDHTRIFTRCPLTMPFRLILGLDSPSMDEPCEGTLKFLGHWIFTNVCIIQIDIFAFASSTPAPPVQGFVKNFGFFKLFFGLFVSFLHFFFSFIMYAYKAAIVSF